jgi:hypothetical protein
MIFDLLLALKKLSLSNRNLFGNRWWCVIIVSPTMLYQVFGHSDMFQPEVLGEHISIHHCTNTLPLSCVCSSDCLESRWALWYWCDNSQK